MFANRPATTATPGRRRARPKVKTKADKSTEVLRMLQEKQSQLQTRRSKQAARNNVLDRRIFDLHSEIDDKKDQLSFTSTVSNKVFHGADATKQNDNTVKKQLRILENQLNALLRRKSSAGRGNEELRTEVNLLRRARLRFDNTAGKLQRQFKRKQVQMAKIMAEASRCFDAKSSAERQYDQMDAKAVEDINAFSTEMDKLGEYLAEQQAQLQGMSMAAKKTHGEEGDDMPMKGRGRHSLDRGGMTSDQERSLRQEYKNAKREVNTIKHRMRYSHEKAFSHETAFEKLKEETGVDSVREIVSIFVDREDENFSMYNYLQNVQVSIKAADRKKDAIDEAVIKYMNDEGDRNEQRKKKTREIEAQRDRYLEQNEQRLKEQGAQREVTELWCRAINRLYEKLLDHSQELSSLSGVGAGPATSSSRSSYVGSLSRPSSRRSSIGPTAIIDVDGEMHAPQVTEHNATQILAIVEQCAVEIIERYLLAAPKLGLKESGARDSNIPSIPRKRQLNMSIDAPPLGMAIKASRPKSAEAPSQDDMMEDDLAAVTEDEEQQDGALDLDTSGPIFADTWRESIKRENPLPGMGSVGSPKAASSPRASSPKSGFKSDKHKEKEKARNFSNKQILGKLKAVRSLSPTNMMSGSSSRASSRKGPPPSRDDAPPLILPTVVPDESVQRGDAGAKTAPAGAHGGRRRRRGRGRRP